MGFAMSLDVAVMVVYTTLYLHYMVVILYQYYSDYSSEELPSG